MRPNLLVLGGTTEATALTLALSEAGHKACFSYAGRVENPRPQPLPTRTGGFGGAGGLAAWLRDNGITHVVDATHPFAAEMSRNAVTACAETGVRLLALGRPAWVAQPGDRWTHVPDVAAAVQALDRPAARVMLAIGRMHLAEFAAQDRHFYLLRLIDAPDSAMPFADCEVIVSQGPFTLQGDTDLLRRHRIDLVVSKNSGGSGARAKIDAARDLDIPVLMIDRPILPSRPEVGSVPEVLDWLDHSAPDFATDRGV